ncbi:MAG: superoxide dismutase family protein [Pseudomonadota bacterium]
MPVNSKKLILAGAAAVMTLSLTTPATASDLVTKMENPNRATAQMINTNGHGIGEITLDESENGVVLRYNLHDMPAGERSMHIHETGDCTPIQTEEISDTTNYFTNAGGHLNPDDKPHGFLHDGGPHAGDLPNMVVDGDGNAFGHVYNDRITLEDNDLNTDKTVLLDDDGAAIVIHEGQDDYAAQPTGAAGDRIACGVIKAE